MLEKGQSLSSDSGRGQRHRCSSDYWELLMCIGIGNSESLPEVSHVESVKLGYFTATVLVLEFHDHTVN